MLVLNNFFSTAVEGDVRVMCSISRNKCRSDAPRLTAKRKGEEQERNTSNKTPHLKNTCISIPSLIRSRGWEKKTRLGFLLCRCGSRGSWENLVFWRGREGRNGWLSTAEALVFFFWAALDFDFQWPRGKKAVLERSSFEEEKWKNQYLNEFFCHSLCKS